MSPLQIEILEQFTDVRWAVLDRVAELPHGETEYAGLYARRTDETLKIRLLAALEKRKSVTIKQLAKLLGINNNTSQAQKLGGILRSAGWTCSRVRTSEGRVQLWHISTDTRTTSAKTSINGPTAPSQCKKPQKLSAT